MIHKNVRGYRYQFTDYDFSSLFQVSLPEKRDLTDLQDVSLIPRKN